MTCLSNILFEKIYSFSKGPINVFIGSKKATSQESDKNRCFPLMICNENQYCLVIKLDKRAEILYDSLIRVCLYKSYGNGLSAIILPPIGSVVTVILII
jgi:hypothetical protein